MAKKKMKSKSDSKALSLPEKKQVVRLIKKVNAQETEDKYITVFRDSITSNAINLATNVPQVFLLNGTGVGTTPGLRIGNKVKNKTLAFKLNLYSIVSSTSDTLVRVMIVYDRSPNGAALTYSGSQISSVNDDFTVGTAAINLPYLQMTRPRYKILKDQTFSLKSNANISSTQVVAAIEHRDWIIDLSKLPQTVYNDGNSAIGSITEGSIYALFITSDLAGANVEFMSRIFFEDK